MLPSRLSRKDHLLNMLRRPDTHQDHSGQIIKNSIKRHELTRSTPGRYRPIIAAQQRCGIGVPEIGG